MGFVNTADLIGDDALVNSIIDRTITEIADNQIKIIGSYSFSHCTALKNADFRAAIEIRNYAFSESGIESANFPMATTVRSDAFNSCRSLISINIPAATNLYQDAFYYCSKLTSIDLPVVSSIGKNAFNRCSQLKSIILRNSAVATLGGTNAFTSTPIASGTGYIYVPRALADSYKAATNWSTYAAQFRALEDYTVDGTITGALDPNKI